MAKIIKWIDKLRDILFSDEFITVAWSLICAVVFVLLAVYGAKHGLDVPMSDIPNEIIESEIDD